MVTITGINLIDADQEGDWKINVSLAYCHPSYVVSGRNKPRLSSTKIVAETRTKWDIYKSNDYNIKRIRRKTLGN
jgi:hypothetical protein